MSRIGVLGGTFDPIHLGHLAAAKAAMECAHLDRVLFVPSAQPPHRAAAQAAAEDRLAMSRLAVDGESHFEVSDIEAKRGGKSFTVDTLEELQRSFPNDHLFLILGWDAARLFRSWHEPDRVSELASIVIVSRGKAQPMPSEIKGLAPERLIICHVSTPDISGSELRRSISAGESAAGKVSPAVERYIAAHHLYGDNR
ncbi:MAG TPA: nicotinate-nucleotide adenylyltransferase [Candidatus Dormibacteraeota bacterium]